MSIKAAEFLAELYPQPEPQPAPASGDGEPPEGVGGPGFLDRWLAAEDMSKWHWSDDGLRLIGPDADPDSGDWDSLPDAIECERCGSIDCWWDVRGNRRCAECDRETLAKSTQLAERAERLRAAATPETAAQRARRPERRFGRAGR